MELPTAELEPLAVDVDRRHDDSSTDEEMKVDGEDASDETEDEYPIEEVSEAGSEPDDDSGTDESDNRQQATDVLLLELVLEVRPFVRQKGIMKRWQAVADTYAERMSDHRSLGLDPSSLEATPTAQAIRKRVEQLHRVYCDPRAQSAHTALSPTLHRLLATYHCLNPGKRTQLSLEEDAPRAKRRRLSPQRQRPSTLETLDVARDTTMMRTYLDGAFTWYQTDGALGQELESVAASRDDGEWTAGDVKTQIKWLARAFLSGQHAVFATPATPQERALCAMLSDYTQRVPQLPRVLRALNGSSVSAGTRRSLDDELLREALDLQPFQEATDADEAQVWQAIAMRLNKRLNATVVFTADSCRAHFQLLRDVRLAGGVKASVRITPTQSQLLLEVERLAETAPARTPAEPRPESVVADDDNVTMPVRTCTTETPACVPCHETLATATDDERDVLTLLLHEDEAQRPFHAGESELRVWEKIRATVNCELRREAIADKHACRACVVVALGRVEETGHTKDEFPRLSAEQRELLRRIKAQGGSLAEKNEGPAEMMMIEFESIERNKCTLVAHGDGPAHRHPFPTTWTSVWYWDCLTSLDFLLDTLERHGDWNWNRTLKPRTGREEDQAIDVG